MKFGHPPETYADPFLSIPHGESLVPKGIRRFFSDGLSGLSGSKGSRSGCDVAIIENTVSGFIRYTGDLQHHSEPTRAADSNDDHDKS